MNSFNFIIPLKKENSGMLTGIASTTGVDKDEERMSEDALKQMVKDIKTMGVNLFGNHEHNWENTLGVIKNAELINNEVAIEITLDDDKTNPKIPMLLNKLKRGIMLGLSVGGNVDSFKWEYNRELGKKIKVLDSVKIYEVSVVGIPSNSSSYLSIPMAIAKGYKEKRCPVCYSKDIKNGVCSQCLTHI